MSRWTSCRTDVADVQQHLRAGHRAAVAPASSRRCRSSGKAPGPTSICEARPTGGWWSAAPMCHSRTPRRATCCCRGRFAGSRSSIEDLFGEDLPPVAYAWAGSFAETRDGLPLIGRVPGMNPRLQFALCYGGNGITYSVHAGDMIRAGIEGRRACARRCLRVRRLGRIFRRRADARQLTSATTKWWLCSCTP